MSFKEAHTEAVKEMYSRFANDEAVAIARAGGNEVFGEPKDSIFPIIQHLRGTVGEVKHLGCGYFEGQTESGKFEFCGGGAMSDVRDEDKWHYSWTYVRADDPQVLIELGINRASQNRWLLEEIEYYE